ncbi:MAG: asparagine synthase (glutamine-hydrolyzing) [Sphingobacteriaceae bacterium]
MCGIAGIILKKRSSIPIAHTALQMSNAIKHRGPDGEGLLVITNETCKPFKTNSTPSFQTKSVSYLPNEVFQNEIDNTQAVFIHRRLAIIDLNDTGHQPMCDSTSTIWITYNGEIYNFKELKEELIKAGHQFISGSDTEVLINSYKEWGTNCVEKLNGMWAFCLYDKNKQLYFASRDRLGVKPFYYINNTELFAFASEQKALIKAHLIKASFNEKAAHNYLTNNLLENESNNFFDGITELWPGENLIINANNGTVSSHRYFDASTLQNQQNNDLSDDALIEKISEKIEQAIVMRMRSDVEVGTCLSGGIDSSIIACYMAKQIKQPIHCFTSVFKNGATNEEPFAELVSNKINAKHHKTEPEIEAFEKDLLELIYALDAPIWDSSTYAQFRVMRLSKENKIKVVLDGQGADELFAGYHHHFISLWDQVKNEKGMFKALQLINESNTTFPSPLLFYLKQKIKKHLPLATQHHLTMLKPSFINSNELANSNNFLPNLNAQLINDLGSVRLKSFLRCEDRCGMWHSVESRTPFSDDIELMQLAFSFDGKRKIKNGVSKYLLREAAKNIIPEEIYRRYDKVGFETPMFNWIKQLKPKIHEAISSANFEFIDPSQLKKLKDNNDPAHLKLLFKLYVLANWKKVFQTN